MLKSILKSKMLCEMHHQSNGMQNVRLTLMCCIFLVIFSSFLYAHPYSKHVRKESYRREGNIILGGLFQIHNYNITEQSCSDPNLIGDLKRAEAMAYAIEKVNSNPNLLPTITLGFDIRDTCANVAVTLAESLNFVPCGSDGQSCCAADSCKDDQRIIAGVVGATRSSTSHQAAILLGFHHMAQISYLSTSDTLSDDKTYPFFLRTVGANNFQVQVMIDFIRQYNWNYISFLNSDNTYGKSAKNKFIAQKDICIGITRTIAMYYNDEDYDKVIDELLELQNDSPNARVVIVFGQFEMVRGILEAATRKEAYERFIWIGSDGWAFNGDEVIEGNEKAALGALTVDPLSLTLDEFNNYFRSQTPKTSDNPWLSSYLVYYGECNQTQDGCEESNLRDKDSNATSHETLVMDAVFAFAHALDAMCGEDPSLCSDTDSFDRDKFLQYLLNTSFDSLANGRVSFLPNGDSAGRYSIHQLQEIDGEYKYVPVGMWTEDIGDKGVITGKVQWHFDIDNRTGAPLATCSLPCALGEKLQINPDNPCCWSCIKCQPFEIVVDNITECVSCIDELNGMYHMPNKDYSKCVDIEIQDNVLSTPIFTISSSGLVFAIVVISLYIYHREKQLVKASSPELAYVMFAGIFLAYITSLLFGVVRLTNEICVIHRMGPPIATSLIYVSLAVKILRLYRNFQANPNSVKPPHFIRPRFQVGLTLLITTIPVIWVTIWMMYDTPPSVEIEFRQTPSPHLQRACILSTRETIGVMVWNIIITLCCCLFAFFARKFSGNEAKLIVFCSFCSLLVLLAFSAMYFTIDDAYYKSAYVALGLIVNATVTLLCLYVIKVYAIYFADIEKSNIRLTPKSHQNRMSVTSRNSLRATNLKHDEDKGSQGHKQDDSGIQQDPSTAFTSQSNDTKL